MIELVASSGSLVEALLRISESEPVCILDSCGVRHLGSHLLIAGLRSVEVVELFGNDPDQILTVLDKNLSSDLAGIFTLSYDFGRRLQGVSNPRKVTAGREPDAFVSLFDALIIHDYDTGRTSVCGDQQRSRDIRASIEEAMQDCGQPSATSVEVDAAVSSNLGRDEYVEAVERIREYIRRGDTYQTNLTQQLHIELPAEQTAQNIFRRLRTDHPAPFSAFLNRRSSIVVSASPERFFRVTHDRAIEASPIKGTRRRGRTTEEDRALKSDLLSSGKDRAENTMIVDLVRNDLGRVCEYGSVSVDELCALEEHPTLFHLFSTVRGQLRHDVRFSDVIRATFPCGSITGAPKIRTMQIIEEIEPLERGLSMGAIGCYLPESMGVASDTLFDLSVAIRTMVIEEDEIILNVGGGIVIDSDPQEEYAESQLKASALLTAIGRTDVQVK